MAEGFKIANAYIDITANSLVDGAVASAISKIRTVGVEAEAAGAKSSATGLLGSKAFLAIGAAAAGGAIAVVKMAGDFQASTTRLVTSAGEAKSNLGLVRDGILQMAGAVGYSAEELSTAMYKIESGGQHGADGLKVLQAAAEGAKTENADLTVVADAVTSAMQDYHLKADDAATVTSKLVAATSAGKMTFQELASSMSAILPVASANHVSLNDILGDLASMTVHGMSAEQASQNLADAIRHMAAPTQQMSKELAALGLNATDISAKLGQRGLSGTVQLIAQTIQKQMGPDSTMVILNLTNALKGLPPQVQALGAKVLDGSMSMKDFTKSARDLNVISDKQVTSFSTLVGSMHGIGTQAKSGAEVYQSYAGAMQKAMGDATGLNVALMLTGENSATTANAIKTVSEATAQADGHVRGWDEIQGTFNQKLSQAKDSLGAMAIQIGTYLLPIITPLVGALANATMWITHHKDMAAAAAAIIGGVLVAGFTALAIAIWAAVAPFVPLAAAIAGVIAVGVLLYNHWSDIKRIAGDVFGFIGGFVTGVWHDVSSVTTTVWDAITGYLNRLWQAHKAEVIATFRPMADFIVNEWNRTRDDTTAVWNAISGFLSAIWNTIRNTVVSVWNAIVNFLSPGLNWFHGLWTGTWNSIVGDFDNIWGRLEGIAQGVWNRVINAFKWGINQVIGLANRFVIDDIDAILKFFLIPTIPAIPLLAGGGTVGAGFQTNGPMAIVGEGNPSHPEYVIPTDPAHRKNAISLYQSLGAQLMADGGILGNIWATVSHSGTSLGGVLNQLVSAIPAGVFRSIASGLGNKILSGITDKVAGIGAFFGPVGGSGVTRWTDTVLRALALVGQPASLLQTVLRRMNQESGGNEFAINRTDSNWLRGTPSIGLMQTIGPTYQAYKMPGFDFGPYAYGASENPLSNILASMRYAIARYGSLAAAYNRPGGYDNGGLLPTGYSHVYNGTGRPEAVFTAKQMDALTSNRGHGPVTINVIQQSSSPQETGRAVALALRTVA